MQYRATLIAALLATTTQVAAQLDIPGGGAQETKDKVIQHNGRGTATVTDYTVHNVGRVYRSCGNYSKNGGPRKVIITGLKATGVKAEVAGINSNYGKPPALSHLLILLLCKHELIIHVR